MVSLLSKYYNWNMVFPPGNTPYHKQQNFQGKKKLLKALWKTSIFVLHENHALPQFVVHTDLLKK